MRIIPFDSEDIRKLEKDYRTPFYIYDEKEIRRRARLINKAFSWNEGFKEYFAVKALPNPSILKILKEEGCGLDCASMVEIMLAERCNISGHDIMFTSNENQDEDYLEALKAGAIVNLDAYEQIDNYLEVIENNDFSLPDTVCMRYNCGSFSIDAGFIGEAANSKFGMRRDQIIESIEILKDKGVIHFGIHAMFAGNVLNEKYYPLLCREVFGLVLEIKEKLGVSIEFVDMAGGIGIPYREDEKEVDICRVGEEVKNVYEELIVANGMKLRLCSEMGRYLTGPCGYLVTKVVGKKETYKKYIGVNASMADLMRPGMYGSYHHLEVLQDKAGDEGVFDVVGPICENNDKFAVDRKMPEAQKGDYIVFCDTGAHSHSMGFNYNGRLRCAEFLLKENGTFELIRRRQTCEDYFATLEV